MELISERVVGRPPSAGDLGLFDELANNPEVGKTMGGPRTEAQMRALLDRLLDQWSRYSLGPHMLFDRRTGEFIGRGGLNRLTVLGADEVEIGYALLPQFWGQGLATEIGRASIDRGFDELGLASIVGFTLTTNVASRHVLEKCGMTFECEFDYHDMRHVFLRISRPLDEYADR